MKTALTLAAFLAAAFLFPIAVNAQAVEDTELQKVVRQRVENFFQAIRSDKWDELHEYVVLVVETGKEKKVKRVTDSADDAESRKVVVERLKGLYELIRTGRIVSIRLGEDNTTADISYMHGDLDGFDLIYLDGDWYYTIEIWQ